MFFSLQTQKTESSSAFAGSDSRQDFNVSTLEMQQQPKLIIEDLHEEPVLNSMNRSVMSPSEGSVSFYFVYFLKDLFFKYKTFLTGWREACRISRE